MSGFFNLTEYNSKTIIPLFPQCGKCGLYRSCQTPKMEVSGQGKNKVLIVGEAPGKNEDEKGIQFVGKAGNLLKSVLNGIGIDLRRDCWITNALICRPPNNKISNKKMISWCRPNLIKTIKKLQPNVIIPLGAEAIRSLIGWLWKDELDGIKRWVGQQIPSQLINAWVCPNWHPSYLGYSGNDPLLEMFFEKYFERAFQLKGKPWKEIPNYVNQIELIFDHEDVYKYGMKKIDISKGISFDFETNMLKPDSQESEIVCCSISDGEKSIAFPFYGKAIKFMKEIISSNIPKYGWNIKFEDRWCRTCLGRSVKNWKWDGMVNAHILDNRTGTTGLKFQAFTQLGFGSYNEEVEGYLKAKFSNEKNRIREVSMNVLLKYCALDSLLEWKICKKQMNYGN